MKLILTGIQSDDSRNNLSEIFRECVSRIQKEEEKYGNKFDKKVNLKLFKKIKSINRKRVSSTSVESVALNPNQIICWLRLVYFKYFPLGLLGGVNQRRFFRRLEKIMNQPKESKTAFYILTEVIDPREIKWISDRLEPVESIKIVVRLVQAIVGILFRELQNTVYLTENKKNENLFYLKLDWIHLVNNHVTLMKSGGRLVKSESTNEAESTRVRFIPSSNKFRMVMAFKSQIKTHGFDQSINYKGETVTGMNYIDYIIIV